MARPLLPKQFASSELSIFAIPRERYIYTHIYLLLYRYISTRHFVSRAPDRGENRRYLRPWHWLIGVFFPFSFFFARFCIPPQLTSLFGRLLKLVGETSRRRRLLCAPLTSVV
jgi:hypothetical protein